MSSFRKVQGYVLDLGYSIDAESVEDEVLVVSKEGTGINQMVLGCADPILIFEQFLFDIPEGKGTEVYKELLQKNRDIIHGAFVLDESGKKVIFRDTLQTENLDLNEVDGTFNSLSLLLSEYSEEILAFSKN